MPTLQIDPLPLLAARAFITSFPAPLEGLPSPDWLSDLLQPGAATPLSAGEPVRLAVRDMLRQGGFKPTGRSKPASEYLVRAAGEGALRSINAAVDACNAVSLHSGLPISVVDVERLTGGDAASLRIAIADKGTSYVFNASGQVIDVGGLVCLFDAAGPCACAVKDAQRTKTCETTRSTLSIVWGTTALEAACDAAAGWYRELLERLGAGTTAVG